MSGLETDVRAMMDSAWTEPGFCVPNQATYPFQWLWDSCFHSVIWAQLGDDRCLIELQSLLKNQTKTGFVPHLTYWSKPGHHTGFWGQAATSTITQPPMYGHAVANLVRAGVDVPDEVFDQCRLGLEHLLRVRPRGQDGLVPVFHPWETGCDDSPRWDDWRTSLEPSAWFEVKGKLVEELRVESGAAVGSNRFNVTSAGFNALVVWNISELASTGHAGDLAMEGEDLRQHLAAKWHPELHTWIDGAKADPRGVRMNAEQVEPRIQGSAKARAADGSARGSGAIRTLDALLPLLVDPRPAGFAELATGGGFSSPFGPRGVHDEEQTYDPDTYWRGPAWPQLTYLLRLAAQKAGADKAAASLGSALIAGAAQSGLSEYWNPETGTGRGARPQSWSGLAIVDP